MLPEKIVDLLFGRFNWFCKHNSKVWNLVPLCLMWTIWRKRNRCSFEDVAHSGAKLLELFYGLLFDWSRVWGFTTSSSLADFVISLFYSLYYFRSLEISTSPKCILYALR